MSYLRIQVSGKGNIVGSEKRRVGREKWRHAGTGSDLIKPKPSRQAYSERRSLMALIAPHMKSRHIKQSKPRNAVK